MAVFHAASRPRRSERVAQCRSLNFLVLSSAVSLNKRGVFRSVVDLQVAINRFVAETNADPKPFVWTADPKRVLAAVKRGKRGC